MIERVSERFSPMDVAVSTICRWGAVLRSRGSLSAWSARDLHRLLKIIAALLAWKLLSIDYSALVDLVGRPPLRPATTPWLRSAVAWVHTHVAVSETVILGVQWFASAGLVLGVFFRQRWLAAIGWLGSLALFVSAHQYVGWMFDIELCCVLLLLVIVWPERWSTLLDGATHVSRSASAMAWSIQLYLGLAYFFTGWSKLHFNLVWIQQIRLEYLHPVMDVWHGSDFNLLGIPRGFHELLMAYPALGIVMALVTLFTELFWITALVSRRARFWLPLVMFATHTGIFFSSGILFLHLAVIQLAAVAPWQRGWYPWRRTVAALTVTPPTLGWRFATGSLAAFAASMAMVPAVTHWNLAWLPDWNQFGWSYAGVTQPQVYYRLGYLNRESGLIEPIPLSHFGFMDFQGVTAPGVYLKFLNESEDAGVRAMSAEALETLLRTVRSGGSDHALLGPFFCPLHTVASPRLLPLELLSQPYVVRGRRYYDPQRDQVVGDWESVGDLSTIVAAKAGRSDFPRISRQRDITSPNGGIPR